MLIKSSNNKANRWFLIINNEKGKTAVLYIQNSERKKKNYQVRILYPKQPSDMKEKQRYVKQTHKLETLSTVSSQ